jgi:hypothetical protein
MTAPKLERVFPGGRKHGLINSFANSVKADQAFTNMTVANKAKVEKEIEDRKKLVKARYLNSRGENELLAIPYTHGAGYPIETWEFHHDHVYEVWKGLVDQVNAGEGLARRSDIIDPNTNTLAVKDGKPEKIHRFVANDF